MVLGVCPDCGGHGLTVNPEMPLYHDQRCNRCMGVGVVETAGPTMSRWWQRAWIIKEALTLPFKWLRDTMWFGPGYAAMMRRSRWADLRDDWSIDTSEMPEVGEEWFARARLRLPDEQPKE